VGQFGSGLLCKPGVVVNDQSASARPADPEVAKTNAFAFHADLDDTRAGLVSSEMIQRDLRACTDHVTLEPLWSRAQEPGAENGRNSEFMTVLSHELRNSLCAVRFAVGILRTETSAKPVAHKARLLIERQVAHMTRLVDDLLDVSRMRHGQLTLQRERVDLRVVLAHASQTVAFTMQERNHHMSTQLPNLPLWLHADPARLEQVFGNLLFNAAKYTEPGGRIWLSAQGEQGAAVVRIRDTGIGIEPYALPRVFELFARPDPSSRRANAGLGIGLAVVRSLVERHGGRVSAASAGRGSGSEFTVRLPMAARSLAGSS
jgi:signal transduction histidine kinase